MKNGCFRKGLVFAIIVLFAGASVMPNTSAQSLIWQWAKSAGGSYEDYAHGIGVDANGNSYITGFFQDTASFGTITLTSSGEADVFVAKMDTNGNWQWAKQAGGNYWDSSNNICVDANGNSYITGYFEGTATFGTITLTSIGEADFFVAKMDTHGNLQWAKNAGGSSSAFSHNIGVDAYGNSYIEGHFQGTATFGTITLTSIGLDNVFVAKMDTHGNWQWAKNVGINSLTSMGDIGVDDNGNSYITGYFYGTATFGTITLTSIGWNDVFVAKMDTHGNWQWAKNVGVNSGILIGGIGLDAYGNSYITGYIEGTATFGTITLISIGWNDVFVAKMDTHGNLQWAKNAGGSYDDYSSSICVDAYGNSYIIGHFQGTATFGDFTLTGGGFVAKMDTHGNWQWAKDSVPTSPDFGYDICVDANGNSYIIGHFGPTATFDSHTLTSSGLNDFYVAKLTSDGENQPPNPPMLKTPGLSSSPGEENYTLIPTFKWNSVPGADQYGLYIRDLDSNELIFDSQATGITISGDSYSLQSGILEWGKHYCWNMNSHNEAGWGEFSSPLYFYTAQLDLLSKIIQQEMQEKTAITVEGKEFYIVTLKRYISPLTWEPTVHTFLTEAPNVRKVYTDTDFIPVVNEQLTKKIGIIDRANNILKRVGSSSSISEQLNVINNILETDEDLANAEYVAIWAKTGIFMIIDLCFYVELGQPLLISSVLSDIIEEQVDYYIDSERFTLEGGRALLEAAKLNYVEAMQIAEENTEGIYNYDTAKIFLDSFYSGYFKNSYGVDIVLPRNRISENAFWEVVGWIPDYINHLGSKLIFHISTWHKIGILSTKLIKLAKKGVAENIDKLYEYLETVREIENKVAQLLEDESFPVDYTSALTHKSLTMLAQWGIHGVDEINMNIACPAELSVYNSTSNITGIVKGEMRMEIPNSFYYNNSITILLPNDTYDIEVIGTGTDEGLYCLTVINITEEEIAIFNATDILTINNTIHRYSINWSSLSQGAEGVTIQIDFDGDGTFEKIISSDNELTQDEFILKTKTVIDIDPDTLNLNSTGNWITCYIELPDGYNVTDINNSAILLNDAVSAETNPTNISDYDNNGISDLMVKFNRKDVIKILEVGDNVVITITGKLYDETIFEGIDYIQVI